MEPIGIASARKRTLSGSAVTFNDVWNSADLRYTVQADNIKEEIILHNASASSRFSFRITSPQLDATMLDNGEIHFTDPSGEVVFTIPAPFAVDGNGENGSVKYELQKQGARWLVDVVVDEEWLNNETRRYPVIVDPSITINSPRPGSSVAYFDVWSTDTTIGYDYSVSGHWSLFGGTYSGTYRIVNPSGTTVFFKEARGNVSYSGSGQIAVTQPGTWRVEVSAGNNYSTASGHVYYEHFSAPPNLRVGSKTNTSITWQWDPVNDPSNAKDGYQIYDAVSNSVSIQPGQVAQVTPKVAYLLRKVHIRERLLLSRGLNKELRHKLLYKLPHPGSCGSTISPAPGPAAHRQM
jgi:hypothetical protein